MCGIAGIHGARPEVSEPALSAMRSALAHRGPDGAGTWIGKIAGLTHARLAIVDLSETGAQPMLSADGRWCMVFNGEIYNHRELRNQLEGLGHQFRGTSDSEVLLAAFLQYGDAVCEHLDGMYAFAIYDTLEDAFFCARDPLGEKPFYYALSRGLFIFASEVRAIVASGLVPATVDPQAIGLLLRQGSIPPPRTHLEGIEMLRPATWLRVSRDRTTRTQEYWRPKFLDGALAIRDPEEALARIDSTLRDSIKKRLQADVPVGAFLSGGLDSSLVCAYMARETPNLRSFTVTLPGSPGDEAAAARQTAQHLGLDHTEVPIVAESDWLERALDAMDVPSIDGPNTWLVSRAVRGAGLKVACSGLGGDELFWGYASFQQVPKVARWLSRPTVERVSKIIGAALNAAPAIPRLSRTFDALRAGPDVAALWLAKRGLFSEKEVAELLTEAMFSKVSFVDPVERLRGLGIPTNVSFEKQVSFLEMRVYMHDQLLRDTDAMSMAHGLEVRLPLLSRDMVELAGKIASPVLRSTGPKGLLRRLASRTLSPDILARPKQGFTLDWQKILLSQSSRPPLPWISVGALDRERKRLRARPSSYARLFALAMLTHKFGASENGNRQGSIQTSPL